MNDLDSLEYDIERLKDTLDKLGSFLGVTRCNLCAGTGRGYRHIKCGGCKGVGWCKLEEGEEKR